jgi:hypothetical protein
VPAKVTKLIGLKRPPFLSPTNLIIFACTQNGELKFDISMNIEFALALNFSFSEDKHNSTYKA